VRVLLNAGAPINARDAAGESALQVGGGSRELKGRDEIR
jgi:hypothetical protein